MTMVGVGVGLFFVRSNAILFVASILIGIGLGHVIPPIIARIKEWIRWHGHITGHV